MEKIKDIFKKMKPWQILAAVGAIVVVIFVFARKTATSTTTTETVPLSSSGTTSSSSDSSTAEALSDSISSLADQMTAALTSQSEQFSASLASQNDAIEASNEAIADLTTKNNTLMQTISSVAASNSSYQENTKAVIGNLYENMSTLQSSTSTPVPTVSAADTLHQTQVNASNQLIALKDTWASLNKAALADGVVSASEKAALDSVHTQADAIGYAAGLQSTATTTDGSARKLVLK